MVNHLVQGLIVMRLHRGGFTFQLIVGFLLLSFTSVSLVLPAANARPTTDFSHSPEAESSVETHADSTAQIDREADMAVVNQALSRKKVREKLQTIGYTVGEIQERLSRLSDKEIHRMAQRLEQVKAGGHLGLGNMPIVILIILVILAPILAIIWLVLMVLGHDVHLHD